MKQEITYSGFSAVPSDYDSADGALAAAINVIPEDGALRPVSQPKEMFCPGTGRTVCYVHSGTGYTNYIVSYTADDALIHFSYYGATDDILALSEGETLTDIIAVGNTLVISTNNHLHYLLYKKDAGYTYLGTQLPTIGMRFGLAAEVVSAEHTTSVTLSDYQSAEESYTIYDSATVALNASSAAEFTLNTELKANTDYEVAVKGGMMKYILYGATASSSTYEKICSGCTENVVDASNAHSLRGHFNTSEQYTKFKVQVDGRNKKNPNATIIFYKGFSNTATGKVIEYNSDNYNAVFAAVNKFVSNYGTEKNRFVFPFFVRYALRLTDGTYARISEPILLVPNSGYAPFVSYAPSSDTGKATKFTLYAFFADLRYCFLNTIDEKWKDIVAGVDVFASQQVYPYNQGQAYDATRNLLRYAFVSGSVDQVTGTSYGYAHLSYSQGSTPYQQNDLAVYAGIENGFIDTSAQSEWNIVKAAPADDVHDQLANISNFYNIYSFDFDDIAVSTNDDGSIDTYTLVTLPLKKGTLSSLVSRQTLTDNSLSSCTFYNAHLVNYNSRLHLYDYSMRHALPSAPTSQQGYIVTDGAEDRLCRIYVYIRTSQGDKIVCHEFTDSRPYNDDFSWFFYPHNGAYKALLVYLAEEQTYYYYVTVPLTQHPFLNGAYWLPGTLYGGGNGLVTSAHINPLDLSAELPTVDDTSLYPSSVIQSPVNAPYTFLQSALNSFPVTRILGMASAVKALSQGQFGQFPLYAFTTDGVWALEVSSTGSYSAKQPVTRDVCTNAAGITQLDSAVIFPTDRGLMLISGSQTTCISDAICSGHPFDATKLPSFGKLHNMLGHTPSTDKCLPTLAFTQFLKQCRTLYDYVHQRIIVYAPGITYAYVYSLKSRQWGMTFSRIASHLNSYPDALAVNDSYAVVSYSESVTDDVKALYLTRPLKLSAPDTLKTISTVIQRGFFAKGHVTTVLYGSRNLMQWHLVWSSRDHYLRGFRGTPYKYFRIASVATLSPDESVSGASVEFTPRQNNLLR